MKKAFLVAALVVCGQFALSQFEHGFIRAGWLFGDTKLENYRYEITNADFTTNSIVASGFEEVHIRNRHIPVEMELYTENVMFSMGCAFRPKKWRKEHEKSPGFIGLDGSLFNIDLAFGGYFSESVGLMVGAQYHWYPTESYSDSIVRNGTYYTHLQPSNDGLGNYYHSFNGGNQRGFGAHLLINGGNIFMLRCSFMYDWIRRRTRPGNDSMSPFEIEGTAMTPEAALYIMFDEDENFGISFSASYIMRQTNFVQVEDQDAPQMIYDPGMKMTGLHFSLNLLIPAEIFASPSYTVTRIEVLN